MAGFIMMCILSMLAATLTTKKACALALELGLPQSIMASMKKRRRDVKSTPATPVPRLRTWPTLCVSLLSLTKHIPLAIAASPKGVEIMRWFFGIPKLVACSVLVHGAWSLASVLAVWVLLAVRAWTQRHEERKPVGLTTGGDCTMDIALAAI